MKKKKENNRKKQHNKPVLLVMLFIILVLILARPSALAAPETIKNTQNETALCDAMAERTSIPFSEMPFDELDSLVLSTAAYLDFSAVDAGETISSLVESASSDSILSKSWLVNYSGEEFLSALDGERYGSVSFHKYENRFSEDEHLQFAAITFDVSDGPIYVAFRGTDNSVAGWEEDADASYLYPFPAQMLAKDYLAVATSSVDGRELWVGGHSKGGNLAEYAVLESDEETFAAVSQIRSYDGFGFGGKANARIDSSEYIGKFRKYAPSESIFGRFYETRPATSMLVVASRGQHLEQHATTNWLTTEDGKLLEDEFSNFSNTTASAISRWIDSYTPEERKAIINAFFDVVFSSGIHDWSDVMDSPPSYAGRISNNIVSLPQEEREEIISALNTLGDLLLKEGVGISSEEPSN